jgi:hypothetical protein
MKLELEFDVSAYEAQAEARAAGSRSLAGSTVAGNIPPPIVVNGVGRSRKAVHEGARPSPP